MTRSIAALCVALLLGACASHDHPDMHEAGDDTGQYAQASGPQNHGGGGQSIWSDVFRTALQTGVGFIHH